MSAATFDEDLVCAQFDFFTRGTAFSHLLFVSWRLLLYRFRHDGHDPLLQLLGCCRGRSGLFQNLHRLAHLCDSEDQKGGVGTGFGSTVAVVDVDTRVAEPRGGTPQLPGTMGKFDLRNFGLFVVTALAVENDFSSFRIVHNETDGAVALLLRELLICKNVDAFFSEGLAE